jgi:hypothetical protein
MKSFKTYFSTLFLNKFLLTEKTISQVLQKERLFEIAKVIQNRYLQNPFFCFIKCAVKMITSLHHKLKKDFSENIRLKYFNCKPGQRQARVPHATRQEP